MQVVGGHASHKSGKDATDDKGQESISGNIDTQVFRKQVALPDGLKSHACPGALDSV